MSYSYKNHSYNVYREEAKHESRYYYEFYLEVDGEQITTATELEREDWCGPDDGGANWTTQLSRYAKAYIDGLEH